MSVSAPSSVTSTRSSSRQAAVARAVEARLDRQHVAGRRARRGRPCRASAARAPRGRPRGRASGRSRRRASRRRPSCAGSGSRPPRRSRTCRRRSTCAVTPGRISAAARSSASLQRPVPLGDLVGDVADDERPGHVGRARRVVVARPDVDQDRLARPQRAARRGGGRSPTAGRARRRSRRSSRRARGRRCRIAAFTRSVVSGSPSSSSTPSPFGVAARSRSRAAPIAGLGRGLGAADARRARRRTWRGGGRRRSCGRASARRRRRGAGRRAAPGSSPGTIACSTPSARTARSATSSKMSAAGVPLRRSSSIPNSSSGWSSNSPQILEQRDLHRADHDVPVAVPLDVEERVAARAAAPRGAAPASAPCRRR